LYTTKPLRNLGGLREALDILSLTIKRCKIMKRLNLFFILTTLFFSGCNDERTKSIFKSNSSENSSFEVSNGVLKFKDKSSFEIFFKSKIEIFENLKNEVKINFPDFISMRSAYETLNENEKLEIAKNNSNKGYEGFLTIVENKNGSNAVINTENLILSEMFNKEGLLIVGSDLFKMEFNKVVKLENYLENEIDRFKKGQLKREIKEISYAPIRLGNSVKNLRFKDINDVQDVDRSCHDVYSGNRAFTAEFILWGSIAVFWFDVSINQQFYAIQAEVKHKKRFGGVWFQNDAPSIRMIAGVNASNGYTYLPYSYDSGYLYNQSSTGFFQVFDNYNYITIYGAGVQVEGNGDDGQNHGCGAYY
jgi:hypothetical protein